MKKQFALFVAAVVSLTVQSNASAATVIINFNFAPGPCGGDDNTYTGIAVAGASSQTWNQLINDSDGSGSLDTILYSDGTLVSGASIKWTSDGNRDIDTNTNFQDSYKNLMGTYDFVSGSEKEKITLKGLTPGDEYTLYLYSQDGNNSNNDVLKFRVNGGSVIILNSKNGQGTDFIKGQNYSESVVTVNSDGKLIIKYWSKEETCGCDYKGVINGFQLVQTTLGDQDTTPVPEPTSTLLLGIGASLLGAVRMRKNYFQA